MATYVCPMHPEITSKKPGECSKCGMDLVPEGAEVKHHHQSKFETYKPLLIIIALILLVTVVLSFNDVNVGTFSLSKSMSYFMSGFFLVFAGFKLLDLKGFAAG